jgi:hypothetical protein
VRGHERKLAAAYAELREEHPDPSGFAAAWSAHVERLDFSEVNTLIGQHNDWFPIERDLAMDPRTKDYVKIRGRSYRREPLGPDWILREFPL